MQIGFSDLAAAGRYRLHHPPRPPRCPWRQPNLPFVVRSLLPRFLQFFLLFAAFDFSFSCPSAAICFGIQLWQQLQPRHSSLALLALLVPPMLASQPLGSH